MIRQFLSFTLNNALYAFDVRQVQEVLEYTTPVQMPCSQNYIEGLISSRNEGITVVNLCKRFNMPSTAVTKKSRIIVLEKSSPSAENPDHVSIFGVTADDVHEVLELDEKNIEPPPKFGSSVPVEYISGINEKDGKFIMLLDVEKIFADSQP
jgi:purine-binding chemotaxis protein CheW